MDVYLIPTSTSGRYELYYEAPDDEVVEAGEGSGFLHRLKVRFSAMLHEAEEWRHRRHEIVPEPAGLLARLRRKTMSFVVERIAEQRLLWHLRTTTEVCARIPSDITAEEADRVIRAMLKKDADHHLKWMIIDLALLLVSAPLVVIPGPNLPGFYFTFQVIGHFLSMRGARRGLSGARWTFNPSTDLSELRDAMRLAPLQRQRRFRELADRLRLEHLATFCEDVAAPTA
jgi:hypothetical protein